ARGGQGGGIQANGGGEGGGDIGNAGIFRAVHDVLVHHGALGGLAGGRVDDGEGGAAGGLVVEDHHLLRVVGAAAGKLESARFGADHAGEAVDIRHVDEQREADRGADAKDEGPEEGGEELVGVFHAGEMGWTG